MVEEFHNEGWKHARSCTIVSVSVHQRENECSEIPSNHHQILPLSASGCEIIIDTVC